MHYIPYCPLCSFPFCRMKWSASCFMARTSRISLAFSGRPSVHSAVGNISSKPANQVPPPPPPHFPPSPLDPCTQPQEQLQPQPILMSESDDAGSFVEDSGANMWENTLLTKLDRSLYFKVMFKQLQRCVKLTVFYTLCCNNST